VALEEAGPACDIFEDLVESMADMETTIGIWGSIMQYE
jgi:hypothetical protein